MPYKYTKRKCAGCGKTIAHTVNFGTPRWHLCPHGRACLRTHGLLGSQGPENSGWRSPQDDPRYVPCRVCATEYGWEAKIP